MWLAWTCTDTVESYEAKLEKPIRDMALKEGEARGERRKYTEAGKKQVSFKMEDFRLTTTLTALTGGVSPLAGERAFSGVSMDGGIRTPDHQDHNIGRSGECSHLLEGGTCILMITFILESWDKVGRDACGSCSRGDPRVQDKNRPWCSSFVSTMSLVDCQVAQGNCGGWAVHVLLVFLSS